MPVSGKLIRELLLLFLLFGVQQSYAQRITRQYNNVSFSAALKDLNARQHKYTINFVYDELEDFRVTKSIRNQSVPDAIMQLIGFYPIRMTQVAVSYTHLVLSPCREAVGFINDESHHMPCHQNALDGFGAQHLWCYI